MKDADKPMKWRRATRREALEMVPLVFTLAMLLGIAWDAIFHGFPDYEDSFYRAIYASVVIPVAHLVLRSKPVSHGGPLREDG